MAQNYKGMATESDWKKTSVHRASTYSCGRCGKSVRSPHEFYRHLDLKHAK